MKREQGVDNLLEEHDVWCFYKKLSTLHTKYLLFYVHNHKSPCVMQYLVVAVMYIMLYNDIYNNNINVFHRINHKTLHPKPDNDYYDQYK